jgi:anti-sigma factor RsiW
MSGGAMSGGDCTRWQMLVQADLDGELSAGEAAGLADHLAACPACRALREELAALSGRLRAELPRHAAPSALRARLQPPLRRRWAGRQAAAFAAGAALAAAITLAVLPPGAHQRGEGEADEVVASHIRALQPNHLTDVLSEDRHTVKPWFDGRIDYAPPVRDLAAQGFPLVGGRLDYLAGRTVAALVYRRDRHLIDLYVWPQPDAPGPRARSAEGYNLLTWAEGGMRLVAVSDLNAADLARFVTLWRSAAP